MVGAKHSFVIFELFQPLLSEQGVELVLELQDLRRELLPGHISSRSVAFDTELSDVGSSRAHSLCQEPPFHQTMDPSYGEAESFRGLFFCQEDFVYSSHWLRAHGKVSIRCDEVGVKGVDRN